MGVTFDSRMTFEKHIHSVSRGASQRIGILRKSWYVFHDRLLLGRCFRGFVLPDLDYCSAVSCSTADSHHKLLNPVVSAASFLTGVCLSVTLNIVDLWQFYSCCTRSGAPDATSLWCPTCSYVPVRVARCAVIAHLHTFAPICRWTWQYAGLLFPCQYFCGTILVTSYSMMRDWRVSRGGPMPIYWPCLVPFISLLPFPFFILWVVLLGSSAWYRMIIAVSKPWTANFFYYNNNNKILFLYRCFDDLYSQMILQ